MDRMLRNVVLVMIGMQIIISVVDGQTWNRLSAGGTASNLPTARKSSSAASHPSGSSFHIFGGFTSSGAALNDLWYFNNTSPSKWSIENSADGISRPNARGSASLVLDTIKDELILFGGTSDLLTIYNDVWVFSLRNKNWFQVLSGTEPGSPNKRRDHTALIINGVENFMIVLGGASNENSNFEVWKLSLDIETRFEWTCLHNGTSSLSPSGRWRHASVALNYNTILVYGGTDVTNQYNDVWTFTISTKKWVKLALTGPSAIDGHAGVTSGGRHFFFGGLTPSGDNSQLLEYNGTGFTTLTPTGAPSARSAVAAAGWVDQTSTGSATGTVGFAVFGGQANDDRYNDFYTLTFSVSCSTACLNSGLCVGPNICECKGFDGNHCQTDVNECLDNNGGCDIHSNCTDGVGYSNCSACFGGYTGNGFTGCIPLCTPSCQNNGTCDAPNRCKCQPGWMGDSCEQPICAIGCKNGGNCVLPNKCECQEGYSGNYCEQALCDPPCLHGGVCTSRNFCNCTINYQYYTGPTCEIPECVPSCQNNGTCDGPQFCNCNGTGFTDPRCSTPDVTFTLQTFDTDAPPPAAPVTAPPKKKGVLGLGEAFSGVSWDIVIFVLIGIVLLVAVLLIVVFSIKEKNARRKKQREAQMGLAVYNRDEDL